jgi:hypothetical protein
MQEVSEIPSPSGGDASSVVALPVHVFNDPIGSEISRRFPLSRLDSTEQSISPPVRLREKKVAYCTGLNSDDDHTHQRRSFAEKAVGNESTSQCPENASVIWNSKKKVSTEVTHYRDQNGHFPVLSFQKEKCRRRWSI